LHILNRRGLGYLPERNSRLRHCSTLYKEKGAARTVATNVRGGVIERCGHWIPEEHPEYLTEQLLAFFG
jgi:pimeloyl-ACP methyl ester carboxylesterase